MLCVALADSIFPAWRRVLSRGDHPPVRLVIIPATPLTIVCPASLAGGSVADGFLALGAAPPDGGADPLALLGAMVTVIAIVGLSVMLTISVRGKIARRNAERPSARELMDKIKQAPHRRDDADATTARMLETAQRLAAQLDNKAERLEQLIARADERVAALDARVGRLSEPPWAAQRAAPPAQSSGRVPDPPPGPLPEMEGGRSDSRASETRAPGDPLTLTIYELTDTGRSPLEIAKALDEQIGKVELILALREG